MANSERKGKSTKETMKPGWDYDLWKVLPGRLKPGQGRPRTTHRLFHTLAEKVPFEALADVEKHMMESPDGHGKGKRYRPNGIYVAHDSMGVARYIGRGDIFARLKARHKANPKELRYFSFYVLRSRMHEREVETLLIRTSGPQLHFNTRKKRVDIQPGDIKDYEPGTLFFERQAIRGRKKRRRKQKSSIT